MKKITNFALNMDDNTKEQYDHCTEQNFVEAASLMPDAHSGYVAPIGSVFKVKDYLVPSWVGYDIGCGMIACKFEKKNIINDIKKNSKEIFDSVNKVIPMGKGRIGSHSDVSNEIKTKFKDLIKEFEKREFNKDVHKFINTQAIAHLGSLGSGNHFIELCYNGDISNELWLVIHSGSRGVGHKVATHYMKEASKSQKDFEKTHALDVNSQIGKEYLNILNFGLEFALLNRLEMAYRVLDVLKISLKDKELNFELWVNKNHNHAILEKKYYIHRKGATPAKKGERGVIPANMRDGSFLVEGLGNEDFLESSSHGAGRKLSRTQAKKLIQMKDFKESMNGIVGKVDEFTLDEAPDAYKNIYDVMEKQKESVKIIHHLKPIINWKG